MKDLYQLPDSEATEVQGILCRFSLNLVQMETKQGLNI